MMHLLTVHDIAGFPSMEASSSAGSAHGQAKNMGGLQAGTNWDDYTDEQWEPWASESPR